MLLNCGVKDSWESLGLQRDPTSPFWRRSALGFLWKEWCQSWNSSTLATSCEELTHWKTLWCWERLGAGGEGDDRGWDGWMASLTDGRWVWVHSGSWWWTGRPGALRFMGSQRVGHDWATELNWTELKVKSLSRLRLFATPWTVAYQVPPSMGFSRQECWSGLPFPSPGDLLKPGIEPKSPALQADALLSEPPGKPCQFKQSLKGSVYFQVT